jgi:hypothetical protein
MTASRVQRRTKAAPRNMRRASRRVQSRKVAIRVLCWVAQSRAMTHRVAVSRRAAASVAVKF